MVSHTRVKTPTAAATFLISHLKEVLDALNDAQQRIANISVGKISNLKSQLSTLQSALPRLFTVVKTRQEARIDALSGRLLSSIQQKIVGSRARIDSCEQRIPMLLERRLTAERHRLQLIEEQAKSLDPALLLRRGYSITLKDGKALRDPQLLRPGDEIETRLEKGTVKSIIKSV
jgi:exodeoxyribonuclease VII large subunit